MEKMSSFLKKLVKALFGLQLRTTLLLTIVVLAATALTSVLYLRIATRLVAEEAKRHVRELARSVAVAVAPDMERLDRESLMRIAGEMTREGALAYVLFADMSGTVLAGSQHGTGYIDQLLIERAEQVSVAPLNRPLLLADGARGPRIDLVYPVSRAAVPAGAPGPQPTIGYVRLGLRMDPSNEQLSKVRRRVVGLAVGITLLMVPLGFEVVHRVAGPINRLAEATGSLARGNLATQVDIDRLDEIGDLARSFNAMARDLARSHTRLVTMNVELERRVVERTRELESTNRQLRIEIEEKEDFLRTVSHDLSAPLRNISGMASMLRRRQGETLTAEAARCLDRIEHNIRQELDLIDELLELSQIHSSIDQQAPVDVHQRVKELGRQLEYDLAQKGIKLLIEGRLPSLYCDGRRIRQLFQNLIDNAIKYTDPSGLGDDRSPRVTISCETDDEWHHFRVADNGIGVPLEDVERIFHVFRRSSNAVARKVSGKGVGLACCKSIVQKYGGRIWVQPNPGGGSIFCFTLSRRHVDPPADGEAPTPESGVLALAGEST